MGPVHWGVPRRHLGVISTVAALTERVRCNGWFAAGVQIDASAGYAFRVQAGAPVTGQPVGVAADGWRDGWGKLAVSQKASEHSGPVCEWSRLSAGTCRRKRPCPRHCCNELSDCGTRTYGVGASRCTRMGACVSAQCTAPLIVGRDCEHDGPVAQHGFAVTARRPAEYGRQRRCGGHLLRRARVWLKPRWPSPSRRRRPDRGAWRRLGVTEAARDGLVRQRSAVLESEDVLEHAYAHSSLQHLRAGQKTVTLCPRWFIPITSTAPSIGRRSPSARYQTSVAHDAETVGRAPPKYATQHLDWADKLNAYRRAATWGNSAGCLICSWADSSRSA